MNGYGLHHEYDKHDKKYNPYAVEEELIQRGRDEVQDNLALLPDETELTYEDVCLMAQASLGRRLEKEKSEDGKKAMLYRRMIEPEMDSPLEGFPLMYMINQPVELLLDCAQKTCAGAAADVACALLGDISAHAQPAAQEETQDAAVSARSDLLRYFHTHNPKEYFSAFSLFSYLSGMIQEMLVQMGEKSAPCEKAAAAAACAIAAEIGCAAGILNVRNLGGALIGLTAVSFAGELSRTGLSSEAAAAAQAQMKGFEAGELGREAAKALKKEALEKTEETIRVRYGAGWDGQRAGEEEKESTYRAKPEAKLRRENGPHAQMIRDE